MNILELVNRQVMNRRRNQRQAGGSPVPQTHEMQRYHHTGDLQAADDMRLLLELERDHVTADGYSDEYLWLELVVNF